MGADNKERPITDGASGSADKVARVERCWKSQAIPSSCAWRREQAPRRWPATPAILRPSQVIVGQYTPPPQEEKEEAEAENTADENQQEAKEEATASDAE